MWAVLVCAVAAGFFWHRWQQTVLPFFDFFELGSMRLFARLWHRCTSNGRCPLPDNGPAIVVANHPNHVDPCFLLANSPRVVNFLHAREYYDVFLLRRLFRKIGCIPVGRDGGDGAGLRRALRRLQEGGIVGIFPEGDISLRQRGRPAKCGAAFLALHSRAPVFPAYIEGGPQRGNLIRDWLYPSRGARVYVGPQIDLADYRDQPMDRLLMGKVTDLFMERIAALRPSGRDKQQAKGEPRTRLQASPLPAARAG